MGGSINIAARFNDGEAICVDGWTNFMPNMIVNNTTLSGDDSIVRKTLMEAASHKDFGGPQPLRANGYGIVVIDFIGRKIHTMQEYTSFSIRILIQLLNLNKTGWQGNKYINVLSEEAEGLIEAKRVSLYSLNREIMLGEILTRERAMELLNNDANNMFSDKRDFYDIKINTDPFEIIEYGEESSLTKMKEILKADGFPLNKSDGLNRIFAKT